MIYMRRLISKPVRRNPCQTAAGAAGFSLAEVLTALTIGAMVMVAVLVIYDRAERAAAAVMLRVEGSQLPTEVLQRIAEDLDRAITAGSDTKITIDNKFENGFATAKLSILNTITDAKNQKQTLQEITWQTSLDLDSDVNGLTLYRNHEGIQMEDRLFDEQRESWEQGMFVPICEGITFFRIQVPQGETFLDKWTSDSPPAGVVITMSFAEPYKTVGGTYDVEEWERIARTVAIDRTRKIKFEFVPVEYGQPGAEESVDPNEQAPSDEGVEAGQPTKPGGQAGPGRQTRPQAQTQPQKQTISNRPTMPNVSRPQK